MRDTAELLDLLDLNGSNTKLLAIVANLRGVEQAVAKNQISYLGFPFSISATFQKRNTNASITEALVTVEDMLDRCDKHQKKAVIYLSMGFGNPYGDEWNIDIVENWMGELVDRGAKIISIADTTGVSTPQQISEVVPRLVNGFKQTEIGLHLHSTPSTSVAKIKAAYQAGCHRFDSALKGYGGCPMADDELTGNIATEDLISLLESNGETLHIDKDKWQEALTFSTRVFDT